MINIIDKNKTAGFTNEQIKNAFTAGVQALDYLKNKMCGGKMADTQHSLKAANYDVYKAIRNEKFNESLKEWEKKNPNKIGNIDAGVNRMLGFLEKANKETGNIKKSLRTPPQGLDLCTPSYST